MSSSERLSTLKMITNLITSMWIYPYLQYLLLERKQISDQKNNNGTISKEAIFKAIKYVDSQEKKKCL